MSTPDETLDVVRKPIDVINLAPNKKVQINLLRLSALGAELGDYIEIVDYVLVNPEKSDDWHLKQGVQIPARLSRELMEAAIKAHQAVQDG